MGDAKVAIRLLKHLGFFINWTKSVLVPTQILEYLELLIDSVRLFFVLLNVKVIAVKEMCEAALAAESSSLREIASLIGNLGRSQRSLTRRRITADYNDFTLDGRKRQILI